MPLRSPVLPLLMLCAAGCATRVPDEISQSSAQVEMLPQDAVPEAWEAVVTPDDRDRLERAGEAWETALGQAVDSGFRRAIRDEGELLDPAVALPRPELPPGPYQCRVIKLGSQDGGLGFAAYKPFQCYVEAEGKLLTIVKQSGSQRPAGRLWPQGETRLVFLGGMALADEEAAPAYGADDSRDVAGFVERVAPFRWRLVVPWPRAESILDVTELMPIAPLPLPQ